MKTLRSTKARLICPFTNWYERWWARRQVAWEIKWFRVAKYCSQTPSSSITVCRPSSCRTTKNLHWRSGMKISHCLQSMTFLENLRRSSKCGRRKGHLSGPRSNVVPAKIMSLNTQRVVALRTLLRIAMNSAYSHLAIVGQKWTKWSLRKDTMITLTPRIRKLRSATMTSGSHGCASTTT